MRLRMMKKADWRICGIHGLETLVNKGDGAKKPLYGKRMACVWLTYGKFYGFGGLTERAVFLRVSRVK